ncbi:MAG: ABC transporter permease [Thermomicrobiales bacterium]
MSQHAVITRASLPMERGLGTRAALRAIGNEVYKGLLAGWSERIQILIELPLFIGTALLFFAVIGKGEEIATGRVDWSLDAYQTTWIFLGYVAFTFYYLQTAKLFWRLLGEIQTGTLEQVYLSPLPSWLLAAAGRVVAAVVETFFVVAAMYLAIELVVDLDVRWRIQGLLPLLFLVVGAVGYSLVIGGLALVWKRIELINDALFGVLFLFGGLLLPLDRMPGWAAAIARLFPVTHAAQSLRNVLLDGRSFSTMSGNGGLVWLTATTVAWLVAGALAFHLGEQTAKRNGSLSRY